MDVTTRNLEHQAAAGDTVAWAQLAIARLRQGTPLPDGTIIRIDASNAPTKAAAGTWAAEAWKTWKGETRYTLHRLAKCGTKTLPQGLRNTLHDFGPERVLRFAAELRAPAKLEEPGEETVRTIEAALVPPVEVGVPMRHQGLARCAKALRELFKGLGIKGVSVTAPNYSMASSVDIDFTGPSHSCTAQTRVSECRGCERVHAARQRLEAIVLATYPDLDDRSDFQVDHHDSAFRIDGRTNARRSA